MTLPANIPGASDSFNEEHWLFQKQLTFLKIIFIYDCKSLRRYTKQRWSIFKKSIKTMVRYQFLKKFSFQMTYNSILFKVNIRYVWYDCLYTINEKTTAVCCMYDDDDDFEIKTRARKKYNNIANTINILRERKIWVVRERVAKTFLLLDYSAWRIITNYYANPLHFVTIHTNGYNIIIIKNIILPYYFFFQWLPHQYYCQYLHSCPRKKSSPKTTLYE